MSDAEVRRCMEGVSREAQQDGNEAERCQTYLIYCPISVGEGAARSGWRKMVSFKEEGDGWSWGDDGLFLGRHRRGGGGKRKREEKLRKRKRERASLK
ncbi:hypothetical protein E2C01_041971 [Portunus trituberculatus]|uniref:Uncharacterized protein n=1 Tax=Portunus trituberculatus TaxID=210409 RepID=A0A5B7FT40_PORTR|nr:hypothetical protein [Portunus trituberculatus]